MTEIRTKSVTGGEKGVKQERYDLIPVEALADVARLYGKGAEKYAEHNWRNGYEWSKSYAALQRHANLFWSGEDIDPEMELPHLAAVAFHALTLMTFMQEQTEFDDRYIPERVATAAIMKDLIEPPIPALVEEERSEEALVILREKLMEGSEMGPSEYHNN